MFLSLDSGEMVPNFFSNRSTDSVSDFKNALACIGPRIIREIILPLVFPGKNLAKSKMNSELLLVIKARFA